MMLERPDVVNDSMAKPLVPAGPACDEHGARVRQAADGAAGQAWLAQRCQKREFFCRHTMRSAHDAAVACLTISTVGDLVPGRGTSRVSRQSEARPVQSYQCVL